MRNAEKVKWEVNLPKIQYLDQLNVNTEHDDNGSLKIATQSVCVTVYTRQY